MDLPKEIQAELERLYERQEQIVRYLLGQWVSELEPTLIVLRRPDGVEVILGLGFEGDLSQPPTVVVELTATDAHQLN